MDSVHKESSSIFIGTIVEELGFLFWPLDGMYIFLKKTNICFEKLSYFVRTLNLKYLFHDFCLNYDTCLLHFYYRN